MKGGDDSGDEQFSGMKQAAEESAKAADAELKDPHANTLVSPKSLTERYKDQIEENMKAHRTMRFIAFYSLGVTSLLYLLLLLCVLWRFFEIEGLAAIVGASTDSNWHVLVLMGLGFAAFSAIPLSLLISLMRMISDKPDEKSEDISITSTHAEGLKLLLSLLKQK